LKKKILITHPYLANYSIDFFNEIQKRNIYDLYVLTDIKSDHQLNQITDNKLLFEVEHIDISEVGPFVISHSLNKHITKISPDLIIYLANPRDIGQVFSLLRMKIKGVKTIAWGMFHRIGGPVLSSTIMFKFISKIADKTMTYSKIGKYYQIARNVDPQSVHVLGTAINEKKVLLERSKVSSEMVENFKKDNNLKDKKVLLQVVRLTAIKKPSFLIETIKNLSETRDDFVLILIGGGLLEEEIKEKVKQLNLEKYVQFIGPLYDEKKLSLWFSVADIFIMTTCIGLSAHHAMSYSLPIVTDNSQQNQASEFDILFDGLNCMLYDEGDKFSFVQKISQVLDDNDLYQLLSTNAHHTVTDIYTLENKVNNFFKIVDSLTIKNN